METLHQIATNLFVINAELKEFDSLILVIATALGISKTINKGMQKPFL